MALGPGAVGLSWAVVVKPPVGTPAGSPLPEAKLILPAPASLADEDWTVENLDGGMGMKVPTRITRRGDALTASSMGFTYTGRAEGRSVVLTLRFRSPEELDRFHGGRFGGGGLRDRDAVLRQVIAAGAYYEFRLEVISPDEMRGFLYMPPWIVDPSLAAIRNPDAAPTRIGIKGFVWRRSKGAR